MKICFQLREWAYRVRSRVGGPNIQFCYTLACNHWALKDPHDSHEQLQLYFQQTQIDSGIIENYKEQLAIQEEMIKTIKPVWYDNKYLWYSMGIASMIVPIWAVGQIK